VALQERRAASQLALRALRADHPDRVDELVVVAEWLIAFGRLLTGDAEDGVFGNRVACLARAHSAAAISGARCTSTAVVSTRVWPSGRAAPASRSGGSKLGPEDVTKPMRANTARPGPAR
jgi:hypothetical protein